jgi:dephospho-CoA kinase
MRPGPLSPLQTTTSPVSVAITGGIGAGKSSALSAFARHGAATASADELVHRLLQEDPEVQQKLADRFGSAVIGPDGGADREAIARIVFEDPVELTWLERLLHPKVIEAQAAWRDGLAARPHPPRVAVTEVPLLFETGSDKRFDLVIVITASPEIRAARRPVADGREARLLSEEEKVRRADFAYVNDGTLEELDAFVASVMSRLGG